MGQVFVRPLLATEHTEFDAGAEALAFALARRCSLPLAGVMPVTSNPEFEAVAPQQAERADAEVAARRLRLSSAAAAQQVALDLHIRRGVEPFEEIVAEARERDADLLVVRRRGKRGFLANLLIGEMVGRIVAHAPCSVLVCPRAAVMWSSRVLVGLDPLAGDPGLLAQAAALAAECRMPLHLLAVAANESARPAAQQALAQALQRVRAVWPDSEGEVRVGRADREIAAAAAAVGADLIVVARHGLGAPGRPRIGSTAQKVIGQAACPVLVVAPVTNS